MSQSAEIVQTHDVDHDDDNRDYESAMMTLVCSSPGPDHVEKNSDQETVDMHAENSDLRAFRLFMYIYFSDMHEHGDCVILMRASFS